MAVLCVTPSPAIIFPGSALRGISLSSRKTELPGTGSAVYSSVPPPWATWSFSSLFPCSIKKKEPRGSFIGFLLIHFSIRIYTNIKHPT